MPLLSEGESGRRGARVHDSAGKVHARPGGRGTDGPRDVMGVRRVSKADAAGCGHAQAVRRVQRGALLRDRQGVPLTLQSLFALFLTPFLRFFI